MWIVLLALRRPYTFVVMALVLLVGGFQVLRQAPTDILPNVDIPVISVVWTYGGLPAQQMEQQITQFSEFSISGNTAGISNVVSETFDESRWAQARAELAASRETLGVVLGLETPAVTEGEPTIPALPSEADSAALVRTRGDVAAAEARVAVAQRRVDESWTDYFPTVVGGFTPFLQAPPTPTQPNVGFSATLALTQPLYDGSARSGLRHDRVAALHAAVGLRDETVQRALGDARAALAQAAARAQGAEAATASAELAAEALRLAQVSYHEGAGTSIELVEAERSSRDAATNASVAKAQAELARVDVLLACGVWGSK